VLKELNTDYSENFQLPTNQAMLARVASLPIEPHSDNSENVHVQACPSLLGPVASLTNDPNSLYSENVLSLALVALSTPVASLPKEPQSGHSESMQLPARQALLAGKATSTSLPCTSPKSPGPRLSPASAGNDRTTNVPVSESESD